MAADITTIALLILPGTFGGMIRGLVGISKKVGKNKEPFKLSKLIFSLLTAMIVGGVTAALTNGDWRMSLLAGYAGSDLLESLYKMRLLGLMK